MENVITKESKFRSVGLVLTNDLHAELSAEAERRTMSMSSIVREALRRYLKVMKSEAAE